jgi:hypothetical protein
MHIGTIASYDACPLNLTPLSSDGPRKTRLLFNLLVNRQRAHEDSGANGRSNVWAGAYLESDIVSISQYLPSQVEFYRQLQRHNVQLTLVNMLRGDQRDREVTSFFKNSGYAQINIIQVQSALMFDTCVLKHDPWFAFHPNFGNCYLHLHWPSYQSLHALDAIVVFEEQTLHASLSKYDSYQYFFNLLLPHVYRLRRVQLQQPPGLCKGVAAPQVPCICGSACYLPTLTSQFQAYWTKKREDGSRR